MISGFWVPSDYCWVFIFNLYFTGSWDSSPTSWHFIFHHLLSWLLSFYNRELQDLFLRFYVSSPSWKFIFHPVVLIFLDNLSVLGVWSPSASSLGVQFHHHVLWLLISLTLSLWKWVLSLFCCFFELCFLVLGVLASIILFPHFWVTFPCTWWSEILLIVLWASSTNPFTSKFWDILQCSLDSALNLFVVRVHVQLPPCQGSEPWPYFWDLCYILLLSSFRVLFLCLPEFGFRQLILRLWIPSNFSLVSKYHLPVDDLISIALIPLFSFTSHCCLESEFLPPILGYQVAPPFLGFLITIPMVSGFWVVCPCIWVCISISLFRYTEFCPFALGKSDFFTQLRGIKVHPHFLCILRSIPCYWDSKFLSFLGTSIFIPLFSESLIPSPCSLDCGILLNDCDDCGALVPICFSCDSETHAIILTVANSPTCRWSS